MDEFEAELKPCFDSRQDIADFENKLTGARKRRDGMDVKGGGFMTEDFNVARQRRLGFYPRPRSRFS